MHLKTGLFEDTSRDKWLVTGGAGYIGAHVAETFLANGKCVLILDNLTKGKLSRVQYLKENFGDNVFFQAVDINDLSGLKEVFSKLNPIGVIHTAGLKSINESYEIPDEYHRTNFHATKNLLELSVEFGVKKLIFSSTAALYNGNDVGLITEESNKEPKSPYGISKLLAENELAKFSALVGFQGTALRFFNVIGASSKQLMDTSSENLLPILYKKIINGDSPVIYGNDYDTPDGTCIRDFVDVKDIAIAHLKVAEAKADLPLSMNLGSGKGYSVLEVLNILKLELGMMEISPIFKERRLGDVQSVTADIRKAQQSIGFEPRFTIQESIKDYCRFSQAFN
jgi:UDP-glucose 4-epimerase